MQVHKCVCVSERERRVRQSVRESMRSCTQEREAEKERVEQREMGRVRVYV